MEGHLNKCKRIYSLQPKKIKEASFARKYVNYLVPALTNITKEEQIVEDEMEKILRRLRYEVDMALVLSTEDFGWSHALKQELQLGFVSRTQNSFTNYSKSSNMTQLVGQNNKVSSSSDPNHEEREMQHGSMKEEEDGEEIRRRLSYLRTILPGGNKMMVDDEMLSELGSYIRCLELQVNVLRSMVQTN